MSQDRTDQPGAQLTRRDFLKTSAGAAVALAATPLVVPAVHAAGTDLIKAGLVGCGGRGSGAAAQVVQCAPNVELWAIGDIFKDRVDAAYKNFSAGLKDKCKVTPETCFSGFDAYKQVVDSGVDLVCFATPPGFRPMHFKYAVEKGKHTFIEKPVAVCPTGVRSVIETSKLAAQKGLGVLAGTCYRHHGGYLETVPRLQGGAIGDILAIETYYNTAGLWNRGRKPEWSEMEWQIRNWYYFTWLSGDHIVEQHVHGLDMVNWILQGHPVKCLATGGRQVRNTPEYGHIYDHFATVFEYPNGVKVYSYCRQQNGCANRNDEWIIGTKGTAYTSGFGRRYITPKDGPVWESKAPQNMYVQELTDLVNSIRAGKPLNDGQSVAESTMTAIMARMSAYTGQEVTWDFAMNQSKLDLTFDKLEWGPRAVDPVAMPGQTKLI